MIALVLVFLTRILAAILMFFFPVLGYFLTLFFDSIDLWLFVIFDSPFSIHYNIIDKSLDFFTLLIALIISFRFEKIQKNAAIFLFIWRLIGFFAFFLTGQKFYFLIFPNIFENFFLFCIIQRKYFPDFRTTKKNLWLIILLLAIPKLFQEWFLHVSGNDMKVYEWIVNAVDKYNLKLS